MAVKKKTTRKKKTAPKQRRTILGWFGWVFRWMWRAVLLTVVLFVLWIAALAVMTPPTTPYMISESNRLGRDVKQVWVKIDDVAPVMARSVVAAEDANFCLHWGFDMVALRQAIEEGGQRGASTLSQQVAKNVFLWHGRSYTRKALEALVTPTIELFWSKQRIIEVYLNVAEFDEGVFGVQSASRHYFGVAADDLSASQAARLAAILPNPKNRSASNPGAFTRRRAESIVDGAATIDADGRASCFQD